MIAQDQDVVYVPFLEEMISKVEKMKNETEQSIDSQLAHLKELSLLDNKNARHLVSRLINKYKDLVLILDKISGAK